MLEHLSTYKNEDIFTHTPKQGLKSLIVSAGEVRDKDFAKADVTPGDETVGGQHARLLCLGQLRSCKYPGAERTVTTDTFSSSPSYRHLKALPIDVAETEARMYTQNLASWCISSIHIPAEHPLNEKGTSREELGVPTNYGKHLFKISRLTKCVPPQ